MEKQEKKYFAGGYFWDHESKYEDFISGGFWQIGWDKEDVNPAAEKSYNLINEINVGDLLAIKGMGGRHDLTVYAIGEVTDITQRENGRVEVKWNTQGDFYSGKAPRGKGAGNWRGTLLQITRPEDIEMIFFNFDKKSFIKSISIENYRTIQQVQFELPYKTKEIYFLGENGDGKTLILQGIILAIYENFIKKGEIIPALSLLHGILDPDNLDEEIKSPAFKADSETGKSFKNYNSIFAYGTGRGKVTNEEKLDEYGIINLFNNNVYLKNPIEWLFELDRLKQYESPEKLENVKTLLEDVLGKFNDTEENIKIEIKKEIRFIERGSDVNFDELSDGYKTVITWICDLLFRLSEIQPKVNDIKDYQGIVLVDEIDLHLHPKWAYSIVRKLREWFPQIQFFFTTHSPIVILGASEDAVIYKVYKEEGITKISDPYFLKDFSNAMANIIITSPLFDLGTAAMRTAAKDLDTNDSSLHSKIYKKVSEFMEGKRKQGKSLFTEAEIDQIINNALSFSNGE